MSLFKSVLIVFVLAVTSLWSAPTISCNQKIYKFGSKDESETIKHEFVLTNRGDTMLHFGKVRACCGAKATVAKKELKPGESVPLLFEMKLKGRKGKLDKNIFIASDDPKTPYLNLKIKGKVEQYYKISERFFRLGDLLSSGSFSEKVTLTPNKNFPFEIKKVESNKANVVVKHQLKDGCWNLFIKGAAPFEVGRFSCRLKIHTTNALFPIITVYVSAKISGILSVTPKEIILSKRDKPQIRFISIRTKGDKFKVLNEELPVGVKLVKKNPQRGNSLAKSWIYSFEFDSNALKNESELKLKTDVIGEEVIVIPVRIR
ncbi:MAG: DUF1573 domain-containing protein [Lentisphaeria bacterium]|nr:DUF1573 domain-containing protein [Lentisphaeria bacterium]